ncbi:PCYCGC motif-containing (lipo)protein, partial [Euzebya sp.]|uniref:PCYCGC motif-containing (lipo)protein n=1 Tax=Euzebya sp. TaxID=1971409 RepID=UPI003513BE41
MTLPPDTAPDDGRSQASRLRLIAGFVALATAVAVGIVLTIGLTTVVDPQASTTAAAPMGRISPDGVLDLTSVDDVMAERYRHAAEHADTYDHVRCYCGCEAAFDHTKLTDCFLRADGGWEAHGAGCGICIAEADAVRDHLDAGTPLPDIVEDIDDRFGPS